MLFNSYPFILGFLPIVLALYFVVGRRSLMLGAGWLVLASFLFYAWWDARYVLLLLGSIVFNFLAGKTIGGLRELDRRTARLVLIVAVSINLTLLGYYKYADFFVQNLSALLGRDVEPLNVILPLGISFFTFTQIAFLADAYVGRVHDYRFTHYALFVTYFPHLIAGPILHHKEMIGQFNDPRNYRPYRTNFEVGLSIFAIGLAKKVLIADSLAPYASGLFDAPTHASLLTAWAGVLAYAFQLYFDFSGYCDMAIGISRLFGIQLPINFNSPYKASSIIDFWRRWHITLSRFLRDYLYIPLGGNERGAKRRYLNLLATMLLGGLWHGAGWTFIIWGALHGIFLALNHGWRSLTGHSSTAGVGRIRHWLSVLLTFTFVCVAWVFFRAPNLQVALEILAAMAGLRGVVMPDAVGSLLGPFRETLAGAGVAFQPAGGRAFLTQWASVAGAALIAFAFPNTQELMRRYRPGLGQPVRRARFEWRPTVMWAICLGLLFGVAFLSLSRPSEFLYFQF